MSTTVPSAVQAGRFTVQPIDQIIFGTPLADALVAEADRIGAKRVFVTSTRSLSQLENGPLQRAVHALGDRHVGTYSRISAHSPREDVIAGANAARAAKADLLVAVGGGSVIDATKAMLLCLWLGLDTIEAMEPYRDGIDGARTPAPILAKLSDEVAKVLKSPDIIARIHELGCEPGTVFGKDFAAFMQAETARWAEVIRISGAKAD